MTSDSKDMFYEELYLSVYSLKQYNPEATVELVCDNDTFTSLAGKRSHIKTFFNNIIDVKFSPKYDKKQRSRLLKTSIRQLVVGDFLYLDCDTIVADSLEEIDRIPSDIAGVFDAHNSATGPRGALQFKDVLAWEGGAVNYHFFNSGVLFVKDTSYAHLFFEKWKELLFEFFEMGYSLDQYALRKAQYILGKEMLELDGFWNCQASPVRGHYFLNKAKIYHYFNTYKHTDTNRELVSVKKNGFLEEKFQASFNSHKKIRNWYIKLLAIRKVLRRNYIAKLCSLHPFLNSLVINIASILYRYWLFKHKQELR